MKFTYNNQSFYIDKILALQLCTLVNNIKNDWDFVLLISGDRMVRVGKSVLGMTVCSFLSYIMNLNNLKTKFDADDIYFDHKVMMTDVYDRPQYAINMYDEGREGLAASKSMTPFQADIMDFFAECGQLNQIFVIVCPDFFELKEPIAVGRSEFLLNVYRKSVPSMKDMFKTGQKVPVIKFNRGYFQLFNRTNKMNLFDKSKSTRRKNYSLVKPNIIGRFINQYPIDEVAYRQKKRDALARFKVKKTEEKNLRQDTFHKKLLIKTMYDKKLSVKEIINEYEDLTKKTITDRTVQRYIEEIRNVIPP